MVRGWFGAYTTANVPPSTVCPLKVSLSKTVKLHQPSHCNFYQDRNISKSPNSEIQRSSTDTHHGWGTTVAERQIEAELELRDSCIF